MSILIGARIGRYQVLERLGEGGMGEVYLGWDEKLERQVALKTIATAQRLDASAQARFLREARALSQLEHPHICQVHDYIHHDEADFLVLELVRGRSLKEAAKAGLTYKRKLEIAEQIARVLVAAHEKAIIHRDLKPDNIMLTDEGQVKVLDFGLSRWLIEEERLAAASVSTEQRPEEESGRESAHSGGEPAEVAAPGGENTNRQSQPSEGLTSLGTILGTMEYMSPEQARGERATTASDLYSFGLILQELLTGKRSYPAGLSPQELLGFVRGGVTVPPESVDPEVAALLGRLKAMAPASRPTAVDTLARVRWIRSKPQRRRKRALLIAAFAAVALFAVAMTVQTVRARRAERAAEVAEQAARKEAETSKQVTDFLVGLFKQINPADPDSHEAALTAKDLLDRGVEQLRTEFKALPEIRAKLLDTLGTSYAGIGLLTEARPLLEEALRIQQAATPVNELDIAQSLHDLGTVLSDQARYTDAKSHFEKALALRERALGPNHTDVAKTLRVIGWLYLEEGRLADAESSMRRALGIFERTLGPEHQQVASTLNSLAMVYSTEGRNSEAEASLLRAMIIAQKDLVPDHPLCLVIETNLAGVYLAEEKYSEAEVANRRLLPLLERKLGTDHPSVGVCVANLAEALRMQGFLAEAEPLMHRSLAIFEKTRGSDNPDVATQLENLGQVVGDQGRFSEADVMFKRSLAIYEKLSVPDSPDLAELRYQYGRIKAKEGKRREALGLLRQSLAAGANQPFLASIRKDYATLARDRDFEAIASQVAAAATRKPAQGF